MFNIKFQVLWLVSLYQITDLSFQEFRLFPCKSTFANCWQVLQTSRQSVNKNFDCEKLNKVSCFKMQSLIMIATHQSLSWVAIACIGWSVTNFFKIHKYWPGSHVTKQVSDAQIWKIYHLCTIILIPIFNKRNRPFSTIQTWFTVHRHVQA